MLLVQACLRAPHVVADEAKLAIVFTYFFLSFSFFFFSAFYFSPTSENLPWLKICFPQHFGITRRYMQKKYFLGVNFIFLIFFFFLFLFSFSPPSTFHPLRGISRAWKFVSSNILSLLVDICNKKKGNFYFLRKKADFCARFRNGQCSVTEPGPTPSPWSIS